MSELAEETDPEQIKKKTSVSQIECQDDISGLPLPPALRGGRGREAWCVQGQGLPPDPLCKWEHVDDIKHTGEIGFKG